MLQSVQFDFYQQQRHKSNSAPFEVAKSLSPKNNELSIMIENNCLTLEESINSFYQVSVCVQLERIDGQCVRLHRQEMFQALKPNSKHSFKFDISSALKRNFYPTKLNAVLTFDWQSFLRMTSNEEQESMCTYKNDLSLVDSSAAFSVSLHRSEFKMSDFLSVEKANRNVLDRLSDQSKPNLLFQMFVNFCLANEESKKSSSLGYVWNLISIDGISLEKNELIGKKIIS